MSHVCLKPSLTSEMQQSRTQCQAAAGQLTLSDCIRCYCHPASTGRTGVPRAVTVARLKQDGGGFLIPRPSLRLHRPLNTHHISAFSQATSKQPALWQDLHCISEISCKAIFVISYRQVLSGRCLLHLHLLHAN